MTDLNGSVHETPGAYANPPGQRRAAALQVCARAADPDDARHLLDVLGLLDQPSTCAAVTGPQDKPVPSTGDPQHYPQRKAPRVARTAALVQPRRAAIHARPAVVARPAGPPRAGIAEPWMTREQCPQPPGDHHNPPRAPMWAEVMAAPQTWDEWMAERAARRAAEQNSEGR